MPCVISTPRPATRRSSAKSDQADIDEGDDDVGEARRVPCVPNEEPNSDAARQHFGRDDGKPRESNSDAQAREYVRRRGRQHDLPKIFDRVEPKHFGDVAVILGDVADSNRGVDHDRPDGRDEDYEHCRRLAVAEGRERDRKPSKRGNGAQDLKDRIQRPHGPNGLANDRTDNDPTMAANPNPTATRCNETRSRQPRPMSCGP